MSGLRDAISFFSIFPAGRKAGIGESIVYYFTVSGLLIGVIPALLFYFLSTRINSIAASALSLSALLLISGFTHLDGVLDSGDALMARGTKEHRLEVLKDRYTGAGAVGTVLVIYLSYFSILTGFTPYYGLVAVIVGEMTSKFSFALSLGFFPTIGEGLGNKFSEIYRKAVASPILINAIPLIFISVLLAPASLIGIAISLLVYSFFGYRLKRMFGGLNGDLIALLGEISRVIFLISFVLLLPVTSFRFSIF